MNEMKNIAVSPGSPILEVRGLCKAYPSFRLQDVSFSLRRGRITGFIGRNGAGKSTTLKSILRLLHPDAGEILFSGRTFTACEQEIRQEIGFVTGGVNFYPGRKLAQITAVTKPFYPGWDDAVYADCLRRFELDEHKTPSQLSAGMQVKYSIALALSHRADLLILDEPTSGLDPVSREDLLELFLNLAHDGKTILFSTHITSDLEQCADDILYIRRGQICAETTIEDFVKSYRVVNYRADMLTQKQAGCLIGSRRAKDGYRALIRAEDVAGFLPEQFAAADLETVMVHLEKEEEASC